MSGNGFLDFLAYIIDKHGEKDLSIEKYKAILKMGSVNPIIELTDRDGIRTQRIIIYESGKIAYDYFPPKYVREHLEKCISNMHFYHVSAHPAVSELLASQRV